MDSIRAAGLAEANRGLDRQARGENVVGCAADPNGAPSTGIFDEDGPVAPGWFGDSANAQRFGRLHDVQAAIAEQENGDDLRFTVANGVSAIVGLHGALAGEPDGAAAVANGVFRGFGYDTSDYETIQRDAVMRRQTRDHTTK